MSERTATVATETVPTGNAILDRHFESGLRAGSLLAIRAPPASQSEGLLYTLMQERPTLYISTLRREAAVQRDIDRVTRRDADVETASIVDEINMDSEMVKKITGGRSLSANLSEQSTPLDETFELVRSLDAQTNVILNSVSPLERAGKPRMYRTVLNELKDQVMQTSGVGILHCVNHDGKPALRETTLSIADTIWTLEHVAKSNEQKYHLTVSKNRGAPITREKIELFLDQRVQIDETRNI